MIVDCVRFPIHQFLYDRCIDVILTKCVAYQYDFNDGLQNQYINVQKINLSNLKPE